MLLRDYLMSDGFSVSVAHEGESALRSFAVQPPDIAVVDVMMPGFSGVEVLMQNTGQVVGKSLLSEQGLGRPFQRYDRSIDVHLSGIRHKLPHLPDGRSRIQAMLRKGYPLLTD